MDVIFIINFIMDFILLYMVKMILKLNSNLLRLSLSATFGAVFTCILTIFPNINIYLQFLFSYIVITTIMIIIAFSIKKKGLIIKACLLLYISTFFLGGILNSLYYHTRLGYYFIKILNGDMNNKSGISYLFVCVIAIAIATKLFIRILNNLRSGEQPIYKTEIHFKNQEITISGLLDTGNNLYDPVTRKPVLVMDIQELSPLLSKEEMEYVKGIIEGMKGSLNQDMFQQTSSYTDVIPIHIRMIPFRSVGKSGLLPAIIMDKVVIWNDKEQIRNNHVLVAVSETRISNQKEYGIILHRGIM